MELRTRLSLTEPAGRLRHQSPAHAAALQIVCDMEILEQRTPSRVVVENQMSEPDQRAVLLRDHRVALGRVGEPITPHAPPIGEDITVELAAYIRPPIPLAPTPCAQPRTRT